MRDRASSFDAEVVALLESRFVPVAVDSWEYRWGEGAGHRFYVALAEAALLNPVNPDDGGRSYQGHYVAAPSGRLLAASNRRGAEAVRQLAAEGLAAWEGIGRPERTAFDPGPGPDAPRQLVRPALVLNVYSRVHGWDDSLQVDPTPFQCAQMEFNRQRIGLDHLWLTNLDLLLLTPWVARVGHRWRAPATLARRIGRFHLVDDVRGEPIHFRADEVRRADLVLEVESVDADRIVVAARGEYDLETPGEERTFHGGLAGRLVYDRRARRYVRFDLLAEGETRGEGRWTPGAPKGTFRLDVAFEIPPDDFAVQVPPQGMRNRSDYLSP